MIEPPMTDRLTIDQLTVVVPARDEERRIGGCLRSLLQSRAVVGRDHPDVTVRIVVVLDHCDDDTEAVVAGFPSVEVVSCPAGRVGTVRAAGMDHAIRQRSGELDGLWLMCTDADSRVPTGWMSHHLQVARTGTALLLGTVRPMLRHGRLELWQQRHHLRDGHPHVHGANLGVHAAAYLAAGGFPEVAEHEDRLLADRVRASGAPVLASGSFPVTTSARTDGRTPGGFAGYLRDLAG